MLLNSTFWIFLNLSLIKLNSSSSLKIWVTFGKIKKLNRVHFFVQKMFTDYCSNSIEDTILKKELNKVTFL